MKETIIISTVSMRVFEWNKADCYNLALFLCENEVMNIEALEIARVRIDTLFEVEKIIAIFLLMLISIERVNKIINK